MRWSSASSSMSTPARRTRRAATAWVVEAADAIEERSLRHPRARRDGPARRLACVGTRRERPRARPGRPALPELPGLAAGLETRHGELAVVPARSTPRPRLGTGGDGH